MQQATTTREPILAVTESPTIEQLQVWWEAMHSDDLSVAYADSFPATLTDFRREVAQGEKLLFLGFVDSHVAGAIWLHDLLHRRDGTVSAGWLGCYFLASYRVNLVTQVLFYGALATAGRSFAPSPLAEGRPAVEDAP